MMNTKSLIDSSYFARYVLLNSVDISDYKIFPERHIRTYRSSHKLLNAICRSNFGVQVYAALCKLPYITYPFDYTVHSDSIKLPQ